MPPIKNIPGVENENKRKSILMFSCRIKISVFFAIFWIFQVLFLNFKLTYDPVFKFELGKIGE